MKLRKMLMITALVQALALFACGDDGGGNGNGNGGNPEEVCNTGNCVDDAGQRERCINLCRETPGDCDLFARDLCL